MCGWEGGALQGAEGEQTIQGGPLGSFEKTDLELEEPIWSSMSQMIPSEQLTPWVLISS